MRREGHTADNASAMCLCWRKRSRWDVYENTSKRRLDGMGVLIEDAHQQVFAHMNERKPPDDYETGMNMHMKQFA